MQLFIQWLLVPLMLTLGIEGERAPISEYEA